MNAHQHCCMIGQKSHELLAYRGLSERPLDRMWAHCLCICREGEKEEYIRIPIGLSSLHAARRLSRPRADAGELTNSVIPRLVSLGKRGAPTGKERRGCGSMGGRGTGVLDRERVVRGFDRRDDGNGSRAPGGC